VGIRIEQKSDTKKGRRLGEWVKILFLTTSNHFELTQTQMSLQISSYLNPPAFNTSDFL